MPPAGQHRSQGEGRDAEGHQPQRRRPPGADAGPGLEPSRLLGRGSTARVGWSTYVGHGSLHGIDFDIFAIMLPQRPTSRFQGVWTRRSLSGRAKGGRASDLRQPSTPWPSSHFAPAARARRRAGCASCSAASRPVLGVSQNGIEPVLSASTRSAGNAASREPRGGLRNRSGLPDIAAPGRGRRPSPKLLGAHAGQPTPRACRRPATPTVQTRPASAAPAAMISRTLHGPAGPIARVEEVTS